MAEAAGFYINQLASQVRGQNISLEITRFLSTTG